VERLTDGAWNAQHLYFTGPTLMANGRRLVFIGDRDRPARGPYDPDAAVNVFVLDRADGRVERLSDNRDGVLRGYVYFGGHREAGIGPGSVALDARAGVVYWLQGRELHRASAVDGSHDRIAGIPPGFVTGYAAVSPDGSRVCLPGIDEAAFGELDRDLGRIDRTVRERHLASHLWVFDTADGRLLDDVEVPGAWVTHVQFRPGDPAVLSFNHEWADGSGERRIWLRDASGARAMRAPLVADPGSLARRDDWVDHEVWTPDGEWLVYHGTYASDAPHALAGRSFVGRVSATTGEAQEVAFPAGFDRYGHVGVGPGGLLVTDGYAEFDDGTMPPPRHVPPRADGVEAPPEDDGGAWLTRMVVDWDAGTIDWIPMWRHGSSWASQDAHPHPSVDANDREVICTSDRGGFRAVHALAVDERASDATPVAAVSAREGW
jgi:hypothetical protein